MTKLIMVCITTKYKLQATVSLNHVYIQIQFQATLEICHAEHKKYNTYYFIML